MSDRALPSKQEIRKFIEDSGGVAGRRELVRAFAIKGQDRFWLKRVIREINADRRRGAPPDTDTDTNPDADPSGALPSVTVIEVTGADDSGATLCRPASDPEAAPHIILDADSVRGPAPRPGDRFLARLTQVSQGYEAQAMRRLDTIPPEITGVLQMRGREALVQPTNRKLRQEFRIRAGDLGGAKSGDLVVVETLPGRGPGAKPGRVTKVLGGFDDPRSISLLAIYNNGIPDQFDAAALAEAENALPVTDPDGRVDLRHEPLITIDPADARDHDDAVCAAPDPDPDNPGGFRILIAIADVAHHVRPGSALDEAALARGVSTYFPDRVAPMLPEALSAGLCSLKPGETRPCLALEMIVDARGGKRRHRFMRGLMRSAANLTYEQAQAAIDGAPDDMTAPLLAPVLQPLFGAWTALDMERRKRGAMAIELPERRCEIGADGFIANIRPEARIDAQRVIEEMMILANRCAAETLEHHKKICVYRVHEPPDPERLRFLKELMAGIGYAFNTGDAARPENFNRLLRLAKGADMEAMVHEAVLRAQSTAHYSTENSGHFGLALRRYAHFTSPIRRYADLLVHRALIDALKAGNDGLGVVEPEAIERIAELVSAHERRAVLAERDAMDRFTAAFLQDRVGALFSARISGVTRAGAFVTLEETGASGLCPMRGLGSDYFEFDEAKQALFGRASGASWRLGQRVRVRLREAAPVTGGLIFEMADPAPAATSTSAKRPGRGGDARRHPPRGKPGYKRGPHRTGGKKRGVRKRP